MKSAKELMGLKEEEFNLMNRVLQEELDRPGIYAHDFLKRMKERQKETGISDEKFWFCVGVAFGMNIAQ